MPNPTGKGGFQERKHQISRKGRPKSFDALRGLAKSIAHEEAKTGGQPLVIDGHVVTVAEAMLRQLAQSKNPRERELFLQIAFGKVPDKVEIGGVDGKSIEQVIRFEWTDNASDNNPDETAP